MGACYSVNLKVNIKDEKGVIKALKEHMEKDTRAVYNIEEYAENGITTETFDDLMKILFADLQRKVDIWEEKKWRCYENDFDASYGWESVMLEWFEVMAPFLGNGSGLIIYPDSGRDEVVVRDGKYVWVR